jgi:uncharacterized membrane protein YraQ (UPF0718 family)
VEFFVFESPKVLMLLVLIVVGVVRSFFTPERSRDILAGKREPVGNVLAALLGVLTPFCSCFAVPLCIGLIHLEGAVPESVLLSHVMKVQDDEEMARLRARGAAS